MTTTKTTKSETQIEEVPFECVSLDEAIESGKARHLTAPFRIRKEAGRAVYEVGRPIFNEDGSPKKMDAYGYAVCSTWKRVSESTVRENWPRFGWLV